MKVGDSRDVPRVAGHGARQEAGLVVNEVGDNRSHKLLRELGDWGWRWVRRRLWDTSPERLFDLGLAPVSKLVDEQLHRCDHESMRGVTMGNGRQWYLIRRTLEF